MTYLDLLGYGVLTSLALTLVAALIRLVIWLYWGW